MECIAELIDYLQYKENIYLYGTGNVSGRLTKCLEYKGYRVVSENH